MSCDRGIYFRRDDICKALECYYGFVPYRVKGDCDGEES